MLDIKVKVNNLFCDKTKGHHITDLTRPFTELWEVFIEHLRRVWHADGWRGTLTPLDTWSRPIWDLHMFYMLRPILFPYLSLFFRTTHFQHPSELSRFCLKYVKTCHICSFTSVLDDVTYSDKLYVLIYSIITQVYHTLLVKNVLIYNLSYVS